MPQQLGVYKTRRFHESPVVIYDTWIDTSVRMPPIVEMQADVRVGGEVRIEIETGGVRSVMLGKYLEVEHGRRLKYTWNWTHRDAETIVTVEFHEATGGCRLTLTHEGFASAGDREAHHVAWDAYLRQLEVALEKRAECVEK